MKLYLVQHAKAASEQLDPQRPLTEQGLQDIRKIAVFVKSLGITVDYLWHSGKKRAVQTADVLSEVLRVKKAVAGRDGLKPNDDAAALKAELCSAKQDIMIVGHMPFLGKLASLLLAGCESADIVAFRQGGIVALSCSNNHWQIDWMIKPEFLV